MRTLRLARIAAEAEVLRLQRMARRTAVRVAIGLLALLFLGCALVVFHFAVWFLLRRDLAWQPQTAALAIAGFDAFIAVILLLIVALSSPGRVEREALDVRRRAWDNATNSLALSVLMMRGVRLAANLLRRRRSE